MLLSNPKAAAATLTIALLALASLPGRTVYVLAQDFRPPSTCAEVAAATIRGGATLSDESRRGGMGCNAASARKGDRVLVERVVDGDTIVLATGQRVRYIGIDAPEVGRDSEPLGEAAARANRRLVEGRYVRLVQGVQDRDRFGRLLRYVFADGILVEAELVREGLAVAREYQPGQPFAACVAALQDEARDAGRGVWSSP
ncbi:MAG: thermonuclease family protein [Dehalococcoidia bacterium]